VQRIFQGEHYEKRIEQRTISIWIFDDFKIIVEFDSCIYF
jgi:hypothetical protein